MRLINSNSRKGVVNLFSDFILNKFDRYSNTIIEVYDLGHFFIVDGKTNSKNVLDLSKIKDEFISSFENLLDSVGIGKKLNIMDLISYEDKNLEEVKIIWFDFFDSERPVYHHKLIDHVFKDKTEYSVDYDVKKTFELEFSVTSEIDFFKNSSLKVKSEFPHGYSLSMGRRFLYYGEYIAYNVCNSFICNKFKIKISKGKDSENEQDISTYVDLIYDREIKSMILDNFDFDFDTFDKKLEDYDFCEDIRKPTTEKPWLVKDIEKRDLILI